jgi:hypothetical protein
MGDPQWVLIDNPADGFVVAGSTVVFPVDDLAAREELTNFYSTNGALVGSHAIEPPTPFLLRDTRESAR